MGQLVDLQKRRETVVVRGLSSFGIVRRLSRFRGGSRTIGGLDADCSYQNVSRCVRRFLVRVQTWMVVGRPPIAAVMGGYPHNIAEPFLTDLKYLADQWTEADSRIGVIECRHFFSGAAAYRNGTIIASLTPVGLAFKVPADVREALLRGGHATHLRYFPKAPIKQEYVLFQPEEAVPPSDAALLILGNTPDPEHHA